VKAGSFLRFSLIWYSQQFAIPFWIVGHVHLHFNNYHSMVELGASLFMHAAVVAGFLLDWKQYSETN
jgi:hypothetical protein